MNVGDLIRELQKLPTHTPVIELGMSVPVRVVGVSTLRVYGTEAGDMNGGNLGPLSYHYRAFPHPRAIEVAYLRLQGAKLADAVIEEKLW